MKQFLPSESYFLGKPVPNQPRYTIVKKIGSGMNGHVFQAHSAELNNDIACKLIPRRNLVGVDETPPKWKSEFQKANSLTTPTPVRFIDVATWQDDVEEIDCIVLCSEFIQGQTLERFVKNHQDDVTIPFVLRFLRTMFDFFYDMKQRRVTHGDLHARNVLVEDRRTSLVEQEGRFRVTDFGVASAADNSNSTDDYLQLASMLKLLLESTRYDNDSARDRYTFDVLNDHFLAKHLTELDSAVDAIARRPRALFARLNEIDDDFGRLHNPLITLTTPFDYLSCEHFGESHTLLKALYSGQFLGLAAIERRNNLVLTGPRGCGKSTVFKSLSLKHRVVTGSDMPDSVRYVGVYYRCDDLYFTFPRYTAPARDEAIDVPVHYVSSTLLASALESLELWARRHFEAEFSAIEPRIAAALWDLLELSRSRVPSSDTFRALSARLLKERRRAAAKQKFAHDPKQTYGRYFGPEALTKACEILRESYGFLRDRPFFFFVDDYSQPKITRRLQDNLNRLLMGRSSTAFFKLATESPVSYSSSDIDGKSYVEGREFEIENLGLTYLHEDAVNQKEDFIRDVFKRRLEAIPNYPARDLETLVGRGSAVSYNEVARSIRQGLKQELHGVKSICNLCSGDIHYVIALVGRMVARAGGVDALQKETAVPKIPVTVQNKAIRNEAGNFLNALRAVTDRGELLVRVVTAFGNVAHSMLLYRDSINVSGAPPHQASRIEPYESLSLSEEAEATYTALIRYAVFLLDVRGKSRRGAVVPRLVLRRFLIPHFNLTFSLRDSVELEPSNMEMLLTQPERFEKEYRLKRTSNAGRLPFRQDS